MWRPREHSLVVERLRCYSYPMKTSLVSEPTDSFKHMDESTKDRYAGITALSDA